MGNFILLFFGIFLFPIFTIGCVLCHYDYDLLGFMFILYSIFKDNKKSK